jgi:hypothetical protein
MAALAAPQIRVDCGAIDREARRKSFDHNRQGGAVGLSRGEEAQHALILGPAPLRVKKDATTSL